MAKAKIDMSTVFQDPKAVGLATQIKDLFLQVEELNTKLTEKKKEMSELCKNQWALDLSNREFRNNYKVPTPTGMVQTEIKVPQAPLLDKEVESLKDFLDYSVFMNTEREINEIIDKKEIMAAVLDGDIDENLIEISFSKDALPILEAKVPHTMTFKDTYKVHPKVLDRLRETAVSIGTMGVVKGILSRVATTAVVCGNKGDQS